jgi:hydrogenase/urease accessory protein HupE
MTKRRIALGAALAWVLVFAVPAAVAHESRPAYLELRQVDAQTYDVYWKVPGQGERMRLALDVEFPPGTTQLGPLRTTYANNAFLQQWRVQRSDGLEGKRIRIVGLEFTLTDALIRVQHLDGTTQVGRATAAEPTLTLKAEPDSWQVVRTYLVLGIEHILTGTDHLLFVLALVILVGPTRRLLWTITAFTVAHSITLAGATLGFVHVPPPAVEASIALSIFFLAVEIIHARNGRPGLAQRAPWMVAFMFGLLHGLGFAGALSEIGLPANAIPLALFFFNVGVEIGQLLFIAAVLLLMNGLAHLPLNRAEWRWKLPTYAIGSVAAFWTILRVSVF